MVAANIIKTLKGGLAFARLTQGDASLDTLDAAMDGARSAGALALRVGARMPEGAEARLAADLAAAVTAGGDGGDRLLLLHQMVELSLPTPRDLAALGLNAGAIAAAMCSRLRQPEGARAEDYAFLQRRFAGLITPPLQALIDDPAFIAAITPQLWQQALDDLSTIRQTQDEHTGMLRELLARTAPGLPLETARAILAEFGTQHDGAGPEEVERLLRAKAGEYQTLQARLLELDNSGDLVVRDLLHAARDRIAEGRFDAAEAKLIEAEGHADRARARIRANRAELATLRLRYCDAARHFTEAAGIVPEDDTEARFGYHLQAFNRLYRQGLEFGEADALRAAIAIADTEMLPLAPRPLVPLDWAKVMGSRGNALQTLGEREGDAAALRDAVAAYRAALEERTRDRVPVNWGGTQHNMAGAALALFRLTGEAAEWAAARAHAQAAVAVFREFGAAGYLPVAEARLAGIEAARPG